MFYIYAFYEPDGTCFYIGKGIGDRHRRNDRRNDHFKHIVAKHNGNVEKKFLAEGLSQEDAFALEIKLIRELKPRANKTMGGEGVTGYTHTQDALDKTGAAQKALWADPLYKEKMRQAHRGKKLTDEQKEHLGNMHRGMTRPPGTGEKIAASKRGKPRSQETKDKIRASLLARSAACVNTTGNY